MEKSSFSLVKVVIHKENWKIVIDINSSYITTLFSSIYLILLISITQIILSVTFKIDIYMDRK